MCLSMTDDSRLFLNSFKCSLPLVLAFLALSPTYFEPHLSQIMLYIIPSFLHFDGLFVLWVLHTKHVMSGHLGVLKGSDVWRSCFICCPAFSTILISIWCLLMMFLNDLCSSELGVAGTKRTDLVLLSPFLYQFVLPSLFFVSLSVFFPFFVSVHGTFVGFIFIYYVSIFVEG